MLFVLTAVLAVIVAVIHFLLMYIEMFAWTTRGKNFLTSMPPETFEPSKILAMNTGLYNGFIGVSLLLSIYSLWSGSGGGPLLVLLVFIVIAGVFGAVTADKKIFLVQSLPAGITLIPALMLLNGTPS